MRAKASWDQWHVRDRSAVRLAGCRGQVQGPTSPGFGPVAQALGGPGGVLPPGERSLWPIAGHGLWSGWTMEQSHGRGGGQGAGMELEPTAYRIPQTANHRLQTTDGVGQPGGTVGAEEGTAARLGLVSYGTNAVTLGVSLGSAGAAGHPSSCSSSPPFTLRSSSSAIPSRQLRSHIYLHLPLLYLLVS
ncbi:predicted protein [Histoplasma capsulatum var. duboisii H88]|uniref:Predicted protein n=2 Tax=Ajellomyces capsulatus TaxID=5037 RepID=F0UE64_AJEC8|nr:predicted protein [Histoplasma capsulatum H143]EGC44594.1 predicted protein [Histoplasma capsulatum var. duboisii H88]